MVHKRYKCQLNLSKIHVFSISGKHPGNPRFQKMTSHMKIKFENNFKILIMNRKLNFIDKSFYGARSRGSIG
jgi:hypothetical protein